MKNLIDLLQSLLRVVGLRNGGGNLPDPAPLPPQPRRRRDYPNPRMLPMGKLPPLVEPRTLKLSSYLTGTLPPPPRVCDFTSGIVGWPDLGNLVLPNCTACAVGHLIEVQSLYGSGGEILPEEQETDPIWLGANGNDLFKGAYISSVLDYWRKHPIRGIAPYAYTYVDPQNPEHVRSAIYLFDGIIIGLALPISAMAQTWMGIWDVVDNPATNQPGSWGQHAVSIVRYDQATVTCVTWGTLQRMTWAFFIKYCDEAWAVLPSNWNGALGVNFEQLKLDLQAVTG